MSHAAPTGEGKVLPANAYTKLAPGERYVPVIPAEKSIAEVTRRSVVYGLIFCAIFSFAAAFTGVKAGQVFEAAIPIAILAVFFGSLHRRKNTLLENVIIQSIGAASGVVVAGTIFTIPALYILKLDPSFFYTFIATALGGFLGILFLVPLRRYFVATEHGNLPFPEATATTEILATGEATAAGASQGKTLLIATAIGGLYDFVAGTVRLWNTALDSRVLLGGWGEALAQKARLVLKLESAAFITGLGYIVGMRYSAIIAAGSVLSMMVLVPAFFYFGQESTVMHLVGKKMMLIKDMSPEVIWKLYVRKIGIGAIATAGIISIIKMSPIILSAFSLGVKELLRGKSEGEASPRTDTDLRSKTIILGLLMTLLAAFVTFFFLAQGQFGGSGLKIAAIAIVVVAILAFLFTSVAAQAIAIVGTNPVSGMTLITLILCSILLVQVGVKGTGGMAVALVIGCVVCTSLSMSGGFITDLKIGYWLGATPRSQQRWKFLGTLVASVAVCAAIVVLNRAYGFVLPSGETNPALPAPQASMMAGVIEGLMSNEPVPYLLYGIGALVALMLEMCKVPPLAFALGMFIPMELNTPLLLGGLVSWLTGRSSKDQAVAQARQERGTLIASGFIAGGALMSIIAALLMLDDFGTPARFLSVGSKFVFQGGRWTLPEAGQPWFDGWQGQLGAVAIYICLLVYWYYDSKRGANEPQ
ncbi:MAG: oligopeptide transporter, OPT family [Deltaproteobacteria bacterium]|nr:oligopeptide transporter, OPT family [Deltaproteobacteria bacterium]